MTASESKVTLNDIWVKLNGFNILRSELYELKKRFHESKANETRYLNELAELKGKVSALEDRNKRMEEKIEHLDSRSRKMNILLYNVEESENETTDSIKGKVLRIVRNVIELKGFSEKDIKNVYRVGLRKQGSSRPVMVTLWEYQKKRLIVGSLQKLKGTGIGVQDDFSYKTRQIRKSLKEYVPRAREAGFKAYLKRDKILINNKFYSLEEVRENIDNILQNKSGSGLDYFECSREVLNMQAHCKGQNGNTDEMKILLAMDAKLSRFNSMYSSAELIKSSDSHQEEKEKDVDCVLHVYKGSMFTRMIEEEEEKSGDQEQT